ncbi:MAG: aspartate/glutamate racemase family protein [Pyrinomonadaceae bacterium]
MKKLAIIDWGIGGISIYKLVKDNLGLPVIYFSDTGATPYGKMTRSELVARLNRVVAFLKDRGVTHLVIGCNAASTAIPFLADQGVKIEGMIDNAVATSMKYKPKRLAVIGGRRTVLSGVYRRGFAAHGLKIDQRIGQPLSGLIESGDVSSDKLRSEAKKILDPIKNCSHILLACTHYPAITSVLHELVSANTEFIDPAGSLIKKISKWKIDTDGADEFLTSGDLKAMKRSAKLVFGVEIGSIAKTTF